ncbi:2-amino-4-hydroxy-6-hydroxymethyldihydropteridinediphosphokinase [Spirosomataceae bacterium TFI 002]|nr:2-amino-4-hydroxy-6-hydroxymethyldihydropteridinediphosphokinase [Spirosomataceae bacterium TFI 002]
MNQVYLGLGSNLGDRAVFLQSAIDELQSLGNVTKRSKIIETAAWGITDVPSYLNMAVLLETEILPLALISKILQIETKLGRQRGQKWGSRVIDIDILFFNNWILNTEGLNIPHPFIVERMFVLDPLLELDEQLIHPILLKSIGQLHKELQNETTA